MIVTDLFDFANTVCLTPNYHVHDGNPYVIFVYMLAILCWVVTFSPSLQSNLVLKVYCEILFQKSIFMELEKSSGVEVVLIQRHYNGKIKFSEKVHVTTSIKCPKNDVP